MTSDTVPHRTFGTTPAATVEDRVLLAVRECCERYGSAKVTIDDIATHMPKNTRRDGAWRRIVVQVTRSSITPRSSGSLADRCSPASSART